MAPLVEEYLKLVAPYKFSNLYNKWAFIACASACLERRVWINEEAIGYLYPNMYIVFVGPPASRKTTTARVPVDYFIKPLDNGPIFCSNQLTPAALVSELIEASKTKFAQQAGPKSSPLFVLAGEFGVWFKDIGGGSMIELLLEFFDSRRPGEEWKKRTQKDGLKTMPNPALTILGCTTPRDILETRLADTAGTGFTSRVVFVCEPRFVPGTTKFPPLDPTIVAKIRVAFYRMLSMEGPFTYAAGAEQVVSDILDRTNAWMSENEGSSTLMGNYMARKPIQIRKVAMCLAAMRSLRQIILPEDLLEAEAMLTELEPTLMHAFGLQIIYQDRTLASKILEKVPLEGWMSEEKLLKAFKMDGQAIPLDDSYRNLLAGLIVQGVLKTKVSENGEKLYAR